MRQRHLGAALDRKFTKADQFDDLLAALRPFAQYAKQRNPEVYPSNADWEYAAAAYLEAVETKP